MFYTVLTMKTIYAILKIEKRVRQPRAVAENLIKNLAIVRISRRNTAYAFFVKNAFKLTDKEDSYEKNMYIACIIEPLLADGCVRKSRKHRKHLFDNDAGK